MRIAVLSDIHDNLPRLQQALKICRDEKIYTAICCGDVSRLDTLNIIAASFKELYLALGNMDFTLKSQTGLFPENVNWLEKEGEFELAGRKIAIVHFDYLAKKLAKENEYDLVFYGHTHTPWEKKVGKTLMINPGEIAGQFGPATFCIFDLANMKGELKILN